MSKDTTRQAQADIRILIVEDHTVVAETGNGRQALDLWREKRPDVTLMDLKLPGLDGVNVIESIRANDSLARIIILTTFDGEEDIYRGIRAGAKAYLLKDVSREELVECIRQVHAGKVYLTTEIATKLIGAAPGDRLTSRELEVLGLLAGGKTNKMIAASLSITEVTVKSHLQSIFRKLNVLSRTEAIAVASRRGLLRSLSD